ncbi:MAG: hypothetical protein RL021_1832 [Bacteroidota bacterium]|jgi:hypothetical protein
MSSAPFHQQLANYVNGGVLRRGDLFRSVFFPRGVYVKNATQVCLAFSRVAGRTGEISAEIELDVYSGDNPHLLKLRELMRPLDNDLLCVLLHGSCGDGRTTGYSDVDALVVIRDEVFLDPQRLVALARPLSAACRQMYRFDALQHHGWFAISEQDLSNFPEEVLPLAALKDAAVLCGERRLRIRYAETPQGVFSQRADRQFEKLEEQLMSGWRPSNLFQLKSLLSEFMLLPVLLMQAKTGKGFSKRESFSAAKSAFDPNTWAIMDEVSVIREKWEYRPGMLSAWVLRRPGYFFRKVRRRWPSRIPLRLKRQCSPDFFQRMEKFITEGRLLLTNDK